MLQNLHSYFNGHPELTLQVILAISVILAVGLLITPHLRKIFYSRQQFFSVLLMLFSTLFCMALIGFRIMQAESTLFGFLVWNLFLAWIPFVLAINLRRIDTIFNSKIITGGTLVVWLIFFPNAPYIVTDLLHLKMRAPLPLWYDLILILSFAWTGLMLGYISLYEIQKFLNKKFRPVIGWIFSLGAIVLCSFGIYLGRFLRWNSWDVVTDPIALFGDILGSAISYKSIMITLLFSIFLAIGYFSIVLLVGTKERSSDYQIINSPQERKA